MKSWTGKFNLIKILIIKVNCKLIFFFFFLKNLFQIFINLKLIIDKNIQVFKMLLKNTQNNN